LLAFGEVGAKDYRVDTSDLSKSERRLWEAFAGGDRADLGDTDARPADLTTAESWGPGRTIRADVIRALLLGASKAGSGRVPGVRLRGARIIGGLDLAGASIAWPLTCEGCLFDEEIVLAEAAVRSVRIMGSRFPGLNGTRMRVEGILNLRECSGVAAVRLDQAHVVGEVCLQGAEVGQETGVMAVSADGMSVDGDVNCAGLVARGAVSLQGLQTTGSLDLTDAQVSGSGVGVLAIGNAAIRGRFIGHGLRVDGEMLVHDTTVTRVELMGASLRNPGGLALSGGGLTVTGGMFCSGGFTAHGPVSLVGARLGANLSFARSVLSSPGKVALKLDRASIGTFDGADLHCSGQISMIGIQVASDIALDRARIDGGQRAIAADGAVIDGTLRLAGMRARGEVTLRTGRVGQRVILTGAELDNPDGTALALSGTEIASDVFCRRAVITGEARLAGTQIRGHLDLDQVRLANLAGVALDATGLRAGVLSLRPAEPVRGVVNLGHARVGVFRDDPSCWPGDLNLAGLTYSALEPQLPAAQRLRWLARHEHGDKSQPYEQLAAHYDALGQPAEARRVLYARERRQRGTLTPFGRAWSFLQDITVAYGYQPWRALLWLALLLLVGSVVFALAPPPPLQASAAPHFSPVVYTLDLLLPVVDLGQKHAFNPAGAEQWLSYLLTGAGWVLATTVAAGAARILSRR
jgi:hypothetical protein